MRNKSIIFIMLLFSFSLVAQVRHEWVRNFNGHTFNVTLTNNNYIVVGDRNNCVLLQSFNSKGENNPVPFSCDIVGGGRDIIAKRNSEFIISGNQGSYPLFIKMNALGDTLWTTNVCENPEIIGQIRALSQIDDTNYIAVGVNGDEYHLGENKIWAISFNDDGNILWSKVYSYGFADALAKTEQNNFIVVGGKKILKINRLGEVLFEKAINNSIQSIEITDDNGFLLTGKNSAADCCLIKMDSLGNMIWEKSYDFVPGKDILSTQDNGYLILGEKSKEGNASLLKVDSLGNFLWDQTLSVSTCEFIEAYPKSFILAENNKLLIVGRIHRNDGLCSFITKYSLSITGIENDLDISQNSFELSQNYPNPFNPSTTISYSLSQNGFVQLNVYDILGREVVNLVNKEQTMGNYKTTFNASNLTSGVYFYKLQSGSFVETKKLLLLQ